MSLLNLISKIGSRSITPLSLKYMCRQSKNITPKKLINHANFLHKELPIRLAQRVIDLYKLPYGLPKIGSTKKVIDLYVSSFSKIHNFKKIKTVEEMQNFTKLIKNIKENHKNLEFDISRSIQFISQDGIIDNDLLTKQLNNFFTSRISIRTLISEFVSLSEEQKSVIEPVNIYNLLSDVSYDAKWLCEQEYAYSPKICIYGDKDYTISYIPNQLYFIFLEICKNSLKATVENNKNAKIKIQFSEGKEDLIVKIKDYGGGFSRDELPNILNYNYTTTEIDPDKDPLLSGYGFGLPLSILYAKYFKGDLQVIPFEGIGTDVLIYINKLGQHSENLDLQVIPFEGIGTDVLIYINKLGQHSENLDSIV